MRAGFTILMLMAVGVLNAQKVSYLTSDDVQNHTIQLALNENWVFKPGHDPKWADHDLNTNDWISLRPVELSDSLADEDGMIEGWFRIRINLDHAIEPITGIVSDHFVLLEVYVDGNQMASFGDFSDTNGLDRRLKSGQPVPFKIGTGQDHLVAIHLITKKDIFQYDSPENTITLTSKAYSTYYLKNRQWSLSYQFGTLLVLITIAFLAWVVVVLNPKEDHLLYIAVTLTLIIAVPLSNILRTYPMQVTSAEFMFGLRFMPIGYFGIAAAIPITFSKIIAGKVHWIQWVLGFVILLSFASIELSPMMFNLMPLFVVIMVGYCIIQMFQSWQNLDKAKWSVVIGLILTMIFFIIFILLLVTIWWNLDAKYQTLLNSSLLLTFPLSLLVYLAIWLKNSHSAAQERALEVAHITEEKNRLIQSQNEQLEEQVAIRTEELEESLQSLKATQSQLIHSEKMASLGELTAGIAHEIQNPLNFVNNFSDVNKELAAELMEEIEKGNEQEAKAILKDIIDNEDKILHHGQRADGIVKGMLQHSRGSSGEKELTDINELADEYLRLAYHGLRAKDKSFNAEFKTELDPNLPKVNVVPQDIGRVLLNLINNAFHAVSTLSNPEALARPTGSSGREGAKGGNSESHTSTLREPQGVSALSQSDYKPTVTISTKKLGNKIQISVKDNGPGIPDDIKDKIFQPFFTTKSTGEGTGLGLSLSYDIITKGHGGEIEIESNEGHGAILNVYLPFYSKK